MASLLLPCGRTVLFDDGDYDLVSKYKWNSHVDGGKWWYAAANGKCKGTRSPSGRYRYERIQMHRLILNAPADRDVDHINGNGLDNRRANLRLCNDAQNAANRRRILGEVQYKGVSRTVDKKKFFAQIKVDNKSIYLGCFVDPQMAARAYDVAARKHFGDFAVTNFPDSHLEVA